MQDYNGAKVLINSRIVSNQGIERRKNYMEKLTLLGTGHALTLDCYNTCFTLENSEGEHLLVDTGGGTKWNL